MKARRKQILWTTFASVLGSISAYLVCADTETPLQYAPGEEVAKITIRELNESSGLASSRIASNLLWTHNDSGGKARLFAIDTLGATVGICDVRGAKVVDWEDMASFSKDGQPYLLVADAGDNTRRRKDYRLYRIPELHPDQSPLVVDQTITFQFEKGPCDCEAIAYDATLDQVILIDKGWHLRCRVFVLDWPKTNTDKTLIAKRLAVLKVAGITSMDISPDGRRAIVLTYGPAYEYVRNEGETWKSAFSREGREIRMPVRRQGEAICYGPDGKILYLTSERFPTPLYRIAVANPSSDDEATRDSPSPSQQKP